MLKREIKFEDFNGEQSSVICYFNISKPEIIELEVEFDEGFSNLLQRIVETRNSKELVKRFREVILLAYGVKSDDGKRFIKSDELRIEFSQTAAFEALYMELLSNEDAAADFITAVLPKDLSAAVTTQDLTAAKLSVIPPPTPPPPPPMPPTPPNS